MTTPQRHYVRAGNTRTSFLEVGDGKPVICIHGTSSDAEMGWAAAFERLARGRRCLAPDLIGSGATEFTGDEPGLDDLVDQVETLAGRFEGSFDLVGYSLGGVVAAAAAARLGARVRRLVTFGAWQYSDRAMCLLFSLWAHLAATDRRRLAELVLYNGASPGYLRGLDAATIELILERYQTLLAPGSALQASIDAQVDIRDRLAAVRAETLVIGFCQDRMVPPPYCRELAKAISDAEYREIDSGHLVMMENPAAILDAIENHLA